MLVGPVFLRAAYGAGVRRVSGGARARTLGAVVAYVGHAHAGVRLHYQHYLSLSWDITVNSCAHRFGRQRFSTGDASRNSYWVALITLGEGFHNNHHWY